LDVGSGTGWTTALLAQIVGEKGRVYGVEIVPELVTFGTRNLSHYNFAHASISQAGNTYGLPQYAPYDKILASAMSMHIPQPLIDQLVTDGVLVMPIHHDIIQYTKGSMGHDLIEKHSGFSFVPLIDPKNRI
jgi:protein-L-isoaspartate(D-aspartate) O-methyltransferase